MAYEYRRANVARTIRFTEKIFDDLRCISNIKDVSFNLLVLQCCKHVLDHYDYDEGEI